MRVLITGGAGFIGTNLASELAQQGHRVAVFDNLARNGVAANLEWLRSRHQNVEFIEGDVRDARAVCDAVRGAERIYHLAAQVAVTTSVTDPRTDFEINLLGAVNVLEAARQFAPESPFFFTSTNKVYGGMEDLTIVRQGERYGYESLPGGISEERPLDFHSPYGCSKGGADQYVRDYSRIYNLPTVVFRMSCIYGPHQCGNEDQGWVAHFAREALAGRGLSFYGDGRQVRDVLYVGDLVRAFQMAADAIDVTAGQVFNIGGGPENTTSLLELVSDLEILCGHEVPVNYAPWRPGDQRIYVSDVRKAGSTFGWTPRISRSEGVRLLVSWLREAGLDRD
ncbi:MAG: SDR family NAD(P)-dependent oxidoreductase [Actinomycetota bacterium]